MAVLLYVLIFFQISVCLCVDHRKRLLRDLLGEESGYMKEVTPVTDSTQSVLVAISMDLIQIRELNERFQYLTVMTVIAYHWTDEAIKWNETEYDNISRILVPASDLWRPDVVLYNRIDEQQRTIDILPLTNLQVTSNGYIRWSGLVQIHSSCHVRVAEYPFDIQQCPFQFGPWTYKATEVNVTYAGDAGLDQFMKNEEWEVLEMPVSRRDKVYNSGTFSDVTFTLVMKRKPMFYLFYLLFPCVLLMILGILVFCLPPESGEKVTLAITVLLAMTVYQLIIMDNIPRTSEEIPILNQYFSASVVMLCMSTILSVMVMNWHFDGTHGIRPTPFVRNLVLHKLSKLVCLWKETKTALHMGDNAENSTSSSETKYRTRQPITKLSNGDVNGIAVINPDTPPLSQHDTTELILRELQDYRTKMDHMENVDSEWKLVALILDRTFLVITIILIIVVTCVIFGKVPTFEGSA